jgi:hypothetical protein
MGQSASAFAEASTVARGFHLRQPVCDGPASADRMVDGMADRRKNEKKLNYWTQISKI